MGAGAVLPLQFQAVKKVHAYRQALLPCVPRGPNPMTAVLTEGEV